MKSYTFVPVAGTFKLAKQESIVLQAIRELGTASLEEIAEKCGELGLKTRQTNERIAAYYIVSLKKLGLVSVSGSSDNGRRVTVVIEETSDEEAA
jgi:Cdc6-like AAA superfamily ATPase